VEHNYHDHARDPLIDVEEEMDSIVNHEEGIQNNEDENTKRRRGGHRGGVAVPFPEKLHYMLSQMDKNETAHIVNWQTHGRCFVVHKPKEFVEDIMPRFFRQTKMTSFQRQLNLYGFARLTTGPDRGGYYHELFIRGRMDLCKRMVRTRVKGNGSKAASSPSTEPNFYAMEPCYEETAPKCDVLMPDTKASPQSVGETSESPESYDAIPVRLAPLLVEDHVDDGVLFFDNADQDEEIVLKLIEGPITEVSRSESWNSLPQSSPTGVMSSAICSMSSLPVIVSPPDLPKPLVSPVRSMGIDLFAPMINVSSFKQPNLFFDSDQSVHDSEALHSGDEVFFEGLPFHYLETKDMEDSLFVVGM